MLAMGALHQLSHLTSASEKKKKFCFVLLKEMKYNVMEKLIGGRSAGREWKRKKRMLRNTVASVPDTEKHCCKCAFPIDC